MLCPVAVAFMPEKEILGYDFLVGSTVIRENLFSRDLRMGSNSQ